MIISSESYFWKLFVSISFLLLALVVMGINTLPEMEARKWWLNLTPASELSSLKTLDCLNAFHHVSSFYHPFVIASNPGSLVFHVQITKENFFSFKPISCSSSFKVKENCWSLWKVLIALTSADLKLRTRHMTSPTWFSPNPLLHSTIHHSRSWVLLLTPNILRS